DDLPNNEKIRSLRRIQIFWAILHKAGFPADEAAIRGAGWAAGRTRDFNSGFSDDFRNAIYHPDTPPTQPRGLGELVRELEKAQTFRKQNPTSQLLTSSSGNAFFEPDAEALLDFFNPGSSGGGVRVIRPYLPYHDPKAADFVSEILSALDQGKTVILDLGNATDEIRKYFSDYLSRAVFAHQEEKFVNNTLEGKFVQLYFEEAHNLFPQDSKDLTGVYARFAKEGAKFHIGMVYSTQSPSTINKELLAQTENFFVAHLSSQDESKALARVQIAFSGIEEDILRAKTPGYMRMLTMSHRFVVPVQAKKFEATAPQPTVTNS
ncbi:MAG: ATP-binding protein, partial [Gammaproteobacteria bacterium]|nr:ATP-binding protein [Gammaproteobacteria bacterium]